MRLNTLVFLVAVGAALSGTTPASARTECTGAYQTDCEYCSDYYGMQAQPASKCDNGSYGYTWQGCAVYVDGRCHLSGGPTGRRCAFNSATDVTTEAGWQVGDINAGPLYTGAAGTMHCKIVLNSGSHSGPAAVDEPVRAAGDAVAVMAPRVLRYRATAADDIALCTSWVPDNGPALYWVSYPVFSTTYVGGGRWSADPASPCSVGNEPEQDGTMCRIWLAVDQRLGTNLAEIWQDCEPYEPII